MSTLRVLFAVAVAQVVPVVVFAQKDKPTKIPLAMLTAALDQPRDGDGFIALKKLMKGGEEASKFDDCDYTSWKESGLSVRFAKDKVTTIFLYADRADKFAGYTGELPAGLTFADTREQVEKKLGQPPESGGDGVIPFWVSYPEKGVSVTYQSKDTKDMKNTIHHIVVKPAVKKK